MLIINTRVDKILVSITCPDEYYAIYANASKELPVAALSVAFASIIIPKLVKYINQQDYSTTIKIWNHTLSIVSAVSFLLLAGTLIFAPEVMTIIYSSKYVEGVDIFRIYLLLIPFHCIEYTLILSAIGKTKYILISSIISMVVNVALDFLGIYTIGVIGLGIATFCSTIIMVWFQLFFTGKQLNVSMLTLLPIKRMALYFVLNCGLAGIIKMLQLSIPLETYISAQGEAVVLGVLWSGLYFLIIRKVLIAEWHGLNYGD